MIINGDYKDSTLFKEAQKIYESIRRNASNEIEIELGRAFSLRYQALIFNRLRYEPVVPNYQELEDPLDYMKKVIEIQENRKYSTYVAKPDLAESYHLIGVFYENIAKMSRKKSETMTQSEKEHHDRESTEYYLQSEKYLDSALTIWKEIKEENGNNTSSDAHNYAIFSMD